MRKFYLLPIFLLTCLFINISAFAQQSVLDPTDSVVDYDPNNPPALPSTAGVMLKWVRTPRMGWNTTPWKAYFYSTGNRIGIAFRLLFPKSYGTDPNKKYPMLIFFHGAGEISQNGLYDNELQLVNCGQTIMNAVNNGSFDGFVLFPQSTSDVWDKYFAGLRDIVNYITANNNLDKSRITISGLSMGGQAAWNFSKANPDIVAGTTPISANPTYYSNVNIVDSLQDIPIWLSQGGLDTRPTQAASDALVSSLRSSGLDVRYTVYPNSGHGVWNNHYAEPDAFSWMMNVNKTNPHVFHGQTEFCLGTPIVDTLEITAGFEAYEWSKNGTVISGANSNRLIVTDTGTYAARYKIDGQWTYWSPSPVTISYREFTQTPPISISGLMSRVIPSPDGKTSVTLALPPGYISYQWRNAAGQVIGTDSLYTASQPGNYVATVTELTGCPAKSSDSFYVASNNGPNPPDQASGLNGYALTQTAAQLNWSNNTNPVVNETGFEIYRGTHSGGPYTLIGKVPTDTLNFIDQYLSPNTNYYYVVRAIDQTGSAPVSNELHILTKIDNQPPTPPSDLTAYGSTESTVTLGWGESTDNVSVKNYGIYINGIRSYITSDLTYTVRNLTHGEDYVFTVKAFDSTGNISPASNQVIASAVYHGLTYKYYTYTGSWSNLPTLSSLAAVDSGMVDNITLDPAIQSTNYALSFQGFINIKQPGNYTFSTSSDDGSKLYINNTLVVNNDGLHSTATKSSTYTFNQQGLYPFRVEYYQEGGGAVLQAFWQKTTSPKFSNSEIPDSAFIETTVLNGAAPNSPANIRVQAISYDSIALTWKDNSSTETGFEIYRTSDTTAPYQIINTVKSNSTTFIDTTVYPSTTYYYKIKSINQYGSSGYDVDAVNNSATTMDLPPAPAAPTGLTATAISPDKVSLSWSTPPDKILTYELYRSDDGGTQYRQLATLSDKALSYIDSMLYGNTSYNYKIEASNVGGVSQFSNVTSATTFNNSPLIAAESKYYVPYDSTTQIIFTASDKDNEALLLTASNLPSFASFQDNGDRTATLTLDPSESQKGTYNGIQIFVADQHGGTDSSLISLHIANIYPPVIQAISPITSNTFQLSKDTLILASGDIADGIKWKTTGMPSFVDTATDNTGNLILSINPGANDVGTHSFQVSVSNNYGMNDTKTINITVNNVPLKQWYLNFASNYSWKTYPGSPWNNIRGVSTAGLLDAQGTSTNVGLSLQTTWWNTTTNGAQTGNDTGVYPDNVIRDNYYFGWQGGPASVTGKITGLDPSKSYIITFFASSIWRFTTDNGHTVYQIGSQKDSLYVEGNTQNTLSFSNVTPDPDSTVTFTMTKGSDAGAGYLNALVIKTQASAPPSNPNALQLTNETVNGSNAVQLNWKLGSNNSNTIEVYRSTTPDAGFTLLNEGMDNGSLETYTDTTVDPASSITYYYYLVASNVYGKSAPSDTETITTNQYVDRRKWYINFASTYSWMPYPENPWNNIRGVTTTGLKDNLGQVSTVGLSLQTTWWRTNTTGAQTGNNSGVYPDNVLRDNYFFGWQGGPAQVMGQITGLDPTKAYIVTFFASSVWRFTTDNGHTVYQIGTQKDSIDVEGNTSNTLTFSNLTPASDGTISFTMSKGSDAGAGYLNAMIVSTQTSTPPSMPLNLQLTNKTVNGANAVQVNWKKGSDNTNTIEVYRSTNKDSGYTLLDEGMQNGNEDHFTDTSVNPSSSITYYYYLVASNTFGKSESTDTASITTSQYIDKRKWYLNFASNYSWKTYPGSPWNNIRAITTTGLLDNQGLSSNIGLNLETTWWKTNTTGAQTGDNSGVYPDDVLRDNYFFGWQGGPAEVTGQITGLNPSNVYTITFFASSVWRFTPDNGHTVYQIGSHKDSIDVEGNTNDTLAFTYVTPEPDGTITFTMSKGIDAGAGYLNALTITTQTDVPPARPVNLELTNQIVNNKNAVRISWQTGSNNTDSIKVYRASVKDGTYALINPGQKGTDSTTLLDTNVPALTADTYYYYLIASNKFGKSLPSDTVNITTANLLPATPTNFKVSQEVIDYKYAVSLDWQLPSENISEVKIYRSTDRNGLYTLQDSVAGNLPEQHNTDKDILNGTTYYYYLIALNDFGTSPETDTVSANISSTPPPTPPQIAQIPDIYVAADGIDTTQISATSSDGQVTFSINQAPDFVTLKNEGNNLASIIVSPHESNIGDYDSVQLIATSPSGYADTVYFNIDVTDGNILSTVYLNLTLTGYTYSYPWNNILYKSGNNVVYSSLVNSTNKTTPLTMTVVNSWTGTQTTGADTYNNSGIVPDSIMATGFYISDTTTHSIKISGLNVSQKYNIVFFGSSNNGGNTNYTTNYTVNNQTVSLNGIRNTSKTARINGLIPNSDGSLSISISKGPGASQGLLNAMIIETYNTSSLIAPSNLEAIARENSVTLNWIDRSDNEQKFAIYRSGSLNGAYTVIGYTSANGTSYIDATVSPDTRYFYKVVALAPNGSTMSSKIASVTTPQIAIYVNFNLKESPAPSPWNNTQTPPQKGDVYGPLFDSNGKNTGITLNMISNFEGENPFGLSTGNNSGLYPDLVMQSAYYIDNGLDTVVMSVENLNMAMKYDFTFYGGIQGWGWQNTSQFIANDQIVSLETSYNTSNTVTLSNLSPDANGQITIKIVYSRTSRFAVLNSMIIFSHNNYDDQGNKIIDPILLMRTKKNGTLSINKKIQNGDNFSNTSYKLVGNVYPNPFHQMIYVKLNSPQDGTLTMALYGINGQIMDKQTQALVKGINTLTYQSKKNLTPGAYILTLTLDGTNQVINTKIIKQ